MQFVGILISIFFQVPEAFATCELPIGFSQSPVGERCTNTTLTGSAPRDCDITNHMSFGVQPPERPRQTTRPRLEFPWERPLPRAQWRIDLYDNAENCPPRGAIDLTQTMTGIMEQAARSAAPQSVNPACFARAMRSSPGSHVQCAGGTTSVRSGGSTKACIDGSEFNKIWLAYHDVARCMKFDPRQYFGIFMHESRFHPNAGNGQTRGARCMGQLTGDGFDGVVETMERGSSRRSFLETAPIVFRLSGAARAGQTRRVTIDPDSVTNDTQEFCNRVQENVRIPAASNSCELTNNPYTCLAMAFTHLAEARRRIHSALDSFRNSLREELMRAGVSAEQVNRHLADDKILSPEFITKLNAQMHHSNNWALSAFRTHLTENRAAILSAVRQNRAPNLGYAAYQQRFHNYMENRNVRGSIIYGAQHYLEKFSIDMRDVIGAETQNRYQCSSIDWSAR